MSTSLLEELFLRRSLGAPKAIVPLKGALPLKDGGEAPIHLVRTEGGLYLAGVAGAGAGHVIDLASTPFAYEERVLGDVLVVGEVTAVVPPSRRVEAQKQIALFRLSPSNARPFPGPFSARHIERPTEVEARYLGQRLEEGELLLAWLETASTRRVPSEVLEAEAPLRFLLTDKRALLVAIGPVGDVVELAIPKAPIEQKKALGRDVVRIGEVEWIVPIFLERTFDELLPLLEAPAERRVLEVARLGFLFGKKGSGQIKAAQGFLAWLLERKDPLATVLARLLPAAAPKEACLDEVAFELALRALVHGHENSAGLARTLREWRLPVEDGLALLERLLESDEEARAFAVELHAVLREALLEPAKDAFAEAAVDIAYAEHLLSVGRYEEAEVVLEARLQALPSEELSDLLPPPDADLTEGFGGQRFRIRIYELLTEARGRGEREHGATLAKLAQLQPLVPSRLKALIHVGEGHAKSAAHKILAVLEPGGLSPLDESTLESPEPRVRPLGKKLIEGALQHPVAREGHAFGRLQAFLAAAKAPDHSALQAYCERFERESAAQRALTDASVALSVPSVTGFISRGDKAIGVRAYEGPVPFLLVGGRHLERESDFWMHPWELRFAITSEVAHLKFKHTRVTPEEVWKGALEKGRMGVDFVLGVLPVLRGVHVVDKIWQIIERYKKGPLGRVLYGVDLAEKTARKVRKKPSSEGPPRAQPIAAANEELVAAHRVMQLSADRAGLLLAGDLGAALRSMFLTTHTLRAELPVAERHGLAAVLGRRDDEGEILFQDLAIRIASLFAFFLSDDYPRLYEALMGEG